MGLGNFIILGAGGCLVAFGIYTYVTFPLSGTGVCLPASFPSLAILLSSRHAGAGDAAALLARTTAVGAYSSAHLDDGACIACCDVFLPSS